MILGVNVDAHKSEILRSIELLEHQTVVVAGGTDKKWWNRLSYMMLPPRMRNYPEAAVPTDMTLSNSAALSHCCALAYAVIETFAMFASVWRGRGDGLILTQRRRCSPCDHATYSNHISYSNH